MDLRNVVIADAVRTPVGPPVSATVRRLHLAAIPAHTLIPAGLQGENWPRPRDGERNNPRFISTLMPNLLPCTSFE